MAATLRPNLGAAWQKPWRNCGESRRPEPILLGYAKDLNQFTQLGIEWGMILTMSHQDSFDSFTPAFTDGADTSLIKKAVGGDRHAFERLYRRHTGRVFAVILRLVGQDQARAEDLTQDTFVKVWQKLADFRFESAFSTWLHRLAVNTALMALRSESGMQIDADGLEQIADMPVPETLKPEHRVDLEVLIGKLPARARAVLVLHDVEGWKHEEIGAELGIAVGSSKAHLHRARQLLSKWLGNA